MTTIRTASIIGFFSTPDASLAENNPEAFRALWQSCEAKVPGYSCGTCSHCGMPIKHHVVIRDEQGKVRPVGTDCAAKVGCDAEQVKYRMTDEQRAEKEARRQVWRDKFNAEVAEVQAKEAAHLASVADIVEILRAEGSSFMLSLADQLSHSKLSPRQAHFVCKAVVGGSGRRNKDNADLWDSTYERVSR